MKSAQSTDLLTLTLDQAATGFALSFSLSQAGSSTCTFQASGAASSDVTSLVVAAGATTTAFYVTCPSASGTQTVTATATQEAKLSAISAVYAVQDAAPSITGAFLEQTLLKSAQSTELLTLTLDQAATGFALSYAAGPSYETGQSYEAGPSYEAGQS